MQLIKLLPYQIEVLNKTSKFNKVAYYLDMGLGKTFVGSEKINKLNTPVSLIVCQKSKINDWYEHFKEYYPEKNIIIHKKSRSIPDNAILIINYDMVWRCPELLKLKHFTLLLDESSLIKNEKSKRTKFILKLNSINNILLSGTPVGGKYEELLSQCHLLDWRISKSAFWDQYIDYELINVGGFPKKNIIGYKNVEMLKRKLRKHGAVFLKTNEVLTLPDQIEITEGIDNTKEYKRFKKSLIIDIDGRTLIGDTPTKQLLYLRQLSSQYNESKINKLKDLIDSTEDRLIIFYNFNEELEIIKSISDKPISIINGSIKDLSNYEAKDDSITLVQYQAGSMGLNLQKANKIIYFSLPLSSELFEQSKKRIHRIGQNGTCFYYYLITKETIEKRILETLKQRRDYTNKLFEEITNDRKAISK